LATIRLRKKRDQAKEKTFKAPGGVVTPLIAIVAIIWLLTGLGKWEIFSTLCFIVFTMIMYFITKKMKSRV
jgi:L-asparagine transporter-like permease